ncbi:MAG: septal ring lytic transglycosylase RlpA family protein [Bacteroidota bacterium]
MPRIIYLLLIIFSNSLFVNAQSFKQGYKEKGEASYYADSFEGRVTANGEKYKHLKATAAHLKLPFGTKVKVTNLKNQKSVVVRINDRGPFIKGRIIDLSKSAAESLDFIKAGITDVEVEVLETPSEPEIKMTEARKKERELNKIYTSEYYKVQIERLNTSGVRYGVQIGTFKELVNMMRLTNNLKRKFSNDLVVKVEQDQKEKLYKVAVGSFPTQAKAESLKIKLKEEYPDAFVVRY